MSVMSSCGFSWICRPQVFTQSGIYGWSLYMRRPLAYWCLELLVCTLVQAWTHSRCSCPVQEVKSSAHLNVRSHCSSEEEEQGSQFLS